MVTTFWHVTSSLNRESIREHGLDWTRMGAARGIAGSREPEREGVFLCTEQFFVDTFCTMNNTGGPVDVWAVSGVDPNDLVESGTGYQYLPRRILPADVRLDRSDVFVERPEPTPSTGAYASTLTITFDDGRVLRDEEAHEFMARHRSRRDPG